MFKGFKMFCRFVSFLVLVLWPLTFVVAEDRIAYRHDPAWPTIRGQFKEGPNPSEKPIPAKSVAGVGVDRDKGLVYILAREKPHVRVFEEEGRFVRAWSPENVGSVHMLHVDEVGNVWIVDRDNQTVTRYSPTGDVLQILGTHGKAGMDGTHFNLPTDVTTTKDYIFVSDGYGSNRVAKFDRKGRYLGMWGQAAVGTKPGQFILPHSITALDDRVYVADRSGGRIQVFDLDGHFLTAWDKIIAPWGIAAFDHHIYVVGQKFGRGPYPTADSVIDYVLKTGAYTPGPVGQDVMVFDTDGRIVVDQALPQGRKFGELDWVHGVDVGADGALYTADVIGNHAQKWRKTTAQETKYQTGAQWGQLPEGRQWGSTSAIFPARDGSGNIWVAERCGENNCSKHPEIDPILLFNPAGKLLKSFGAGLFVWPHGIHVDPENNVWVTDAAGAGGKGHQVHKFRADGTLLMSLGTAGVSGESGTFFTGPSDVLVAPSGHIFVADGHGAEGNNRIVKFESDGTFIKAWGTTGTSPGNLKDPHALAMDSQGRLFVGDRGNNRIQLFDQEGHYLALWTGFGRPSGLYIDQNDILYAADSESQGSWTNSIAVWQRGIRIGSAKDGYLMQMIPDATENPDLNNTTGAEGIAVDAKGNIYGAEVGSRMIRKYSKP